MEIIGVPGDREELSRFAEALLRPRRRPAARRGLDETLHLIFDLGECLIQAFGESM